MNDDHTPGPLSIGTVRGWAFGLLGIPRRDFYEMRPGEFWEAMNAYSEEVSADRRHLGELMRGAAIRLWNVQVTKESRIYDPRTFWQMPWDELCPESSEVERLSSLSEAEMKEEAEKFFKRVTNGKV